MKGNTPKTIQFDLNIILKSGKGLTAGEKETLWIQPDPGLKNVISWPEGVILCPLIGRVGSYKSK